METGLRNALFEILPNIKAVSKAAAALRLTAAMTFLIPALRLAHAGPDDVLERGAYLAWITGCVGCHSPRTDEGYVVPEALLSGGNHPIGAGALGKLYPPNITPDVETGIGSWSIEDIVKALKEGSTPGGRILSPAMPWRSQFNKLTDDDARAIALYLKSLPPASNRVPPPIPAANVPAGVSQKH